MTFELLRLLHQALFGALAASGFGVLFNFGWRELPWCAASGALALATRMLGLDAGWTVEAASFTAAAAVGCAGRVLRARLGIASTALAVSGCIPMVPGSFAAQAIFGLFELTSLHLDDPGKVSDDNHGIHATCDLYDRCDWGWPVDGHTHFPEPSFMTNSGAKFWSRTDPVL